MPDAYFTTPLSALTRRWRIFYDEAQSLNPQAEKPDFEELHGTGNDARIYRFSQTQLAVSTESAPFYTSLRKRIPALTVYTASVLLFPDALLDTVAEVIRARRVRQVSEEEKARLRSIGKQFLPFSQRRQTALESTNAPLDTLDVPQAENTEKGSVGEG